MRVSSFPLSTLKEVPADAEIISHQLMLRAGMIRKLAAGIYTWLPVGLKVLRKVEAIVREEMNRAGAVELLMPSVQPAELWEESGRWAQYGPELLRIRDRHNREFCYGPTHEEVITDFARRELRSYKQLPVNYYQIQTKFRDEIRPRFGVMRAREFLMKDAYSFHVDQASLQLTYDVMYAAYNQIFERIGLRFRAVRADTGSIGGSSSHEFHVLADSGEDAIAYSSSGDYAANVELAEALPPTEPRKAPVSTMTKVSTPGTIRCEDVAALLEQKLQQTVKAIAVMHSDRFCLLLLRGDHQLNEIKVTKISGMGEFRFATEEEIVAHLKCVPGYIGPVGVGDNVSIIADRAVTSLSDFTCGANEAGYHLTGVNWGRDLAEPQIVADIRNVVTNDPSPDGNGLLEIARGIEVGHIFQLGDKYSAALGATVLDEAGNNRVTTMGCYGIGVSRIVAAAIEQNHDDRGIVWPESIAPFTVALCPIQYHKSERTREAVEQLYTELRSAGVDVLLDDRDVRPGVMFADMELIGIPHRIVVGERSLDKGTVEYRHRTAGEAEDLPMDQVMARVLKSRN